MDDVPSENQLNEMFGVDGNRSKAIAWLVNRLTYAEVLGVRVAHAYSEDQGNRHLQVTEQSLKILGVTEAELHSAFLLLPTPVGKENDDSGD